VKHESSRKLFAYWNFRRGSRRAPERNEIEPGGIGSALGDTFVLAYDGGDPVFRLAGSRVCALFGRELRNEPFAAVWQTQCRSSLIELLLGVASENLAAVMGATAQTAEGFEARLECLLLPLRHAGRTHERMIGVLAPLVPPVWLGASQLDRLGLTSARQMDLHNETLATPDLVTAARLARNRPALVVYDGGRS
jgi:hypothetical protein